MAARSVGLMQLSEAPQGSCKVRSTSRYNPIEQQDGFKQAFFLFKTVLIFHRFASLLRPALSNV